MTYMHLQASAMKYRAQTFPGFSLMESRTPRHERTVMSWSKTPFDRSKTYIVQSQSLDQMPLSPSWTDVTGRVYPAPMAVSTACRHTYRNACASSALLICMNDVYNSCYTCMHHEEGTKCKHMLLALIKVWYAHVPPQSFSWHHSRGHPHLQCNTWHVHTTDVLVNWWSQKGKHV